MTPNFAEQQPTKFEQPETLGGLPVRTDLRAGLAWDDLDDQAASLWNQLTSAVSSAVSNVTGSTPTA